MAMLAGWKVGADIAGPLYIADPVAVLQRLVDLAVSGSLVHHTLVTARLSILGSLAGLRHVDRRLVDMARVLGASDAQTGRVVIWRSMLPFFFAALRIAVPRAVSAAVIGEFLVGGDGIGHLIESSRQNVDTVGVFAGLVVATALVVAATTVVCHMERHLVAWRQTEHQLSI